jgi:hypothetical protein
LALAGRPIMRCVFMSLLVLALTTPQALFAQTNALRSRRPSEVARPSQLLGIVGGENTRASAGARFMPSPVIGQPLGPLALPGAGYSRPAPLQGLGLPGAGAGSLGPVFQILQSTSMGTGYTVPMLAAPPGLRSYAESLASEFTPTEALGPAAWPTSAQSAEEQPPPAPEDLPSLGQATQTRLETLETSYLHQGVAAFRADRYQQARAAFKIAAAMQLQPATGQLGALHADFAVGNYQSAAAELSPLLRAGADAMSSNFASSLYASTAKLDEHVAAFSRWYKQLRQDPSMQALAAYILWVNNRPELARSEAQALIKQVPDEDAYRTLLTVLDATPPSSQPAP